MMACAGGCGPALITMPGLCNLLHGLVQIPLHCTGIGIPASCIQTSTVLQLAVGVIAEEIRRADCSKLTRDALVAVDEIGKFEIVFPGKPLHVLKTVCGIGLHVIWHDGNTAHTQRHQFVGVSHQLFRDGLYIGTMIADEHHQQPGLAHAFIPTPAAAVDTIEAKIRYGPAKIANGGFCQNH